MVAYSTDFSSNITSLWPINGKLPFQRDASFDPVFLGPPNAVPIGLPR